MQTGLYRSHWHVEDVNSLLAAEALNLAQHEHGAEAFRKLASKWLLAAGIGGAALAAIAGFADFFGNSRIRALRDAWLHMFANLTAVVLEAVNFFLRLAEESAAGSTGLALSVAVALILLFSGWKGGALVYRHGVGQSRGDPSDRATR